MPPAGGTRGSPAGGTKSSPAGGRRFRAAAAREAQNPFSLREKTVFSNSKRTPEGISSSPLDSLETTQREGPAGPSLWNLTPWRRGTGDCSVKKTYRWHVFSVSRRRCAAGIGAQRCQWQSKQAPIEEVPRLAASGGGRESAGTTVGNREALEVIHCRLRAGTRRWGS